MRPVAVTCSPRARAEIEDAYDWVAQAFDPRTASSTIAAIKKTAEILADFPNAGRATDIAGVRMLPVVKYPYLVYPPSATTKSSSFTFAMHDAAHQKRPASREAA